MVQKEMKYMKKKSPEMKNRITEMRNALDEINSRFFTAEEEISEFADVETNYPK